jgi:tetratricopeptide (TPR) repeat protein
LAYEQKGMYREAIAEFRQAVANSNQHPTAMASLAHAYAASGNRGEAHKILSELKDSSPRRYVSPYGIALIYVGLEEKQQAFRWLEKADEKGNIELVWIKVEPRLDPLRSDPRFADLMRKIGLPQ